MSVKMAYLVATLSAQSPRAWKQFLQDAWMQGAWQRLQWSEADSRWVLPDQGAVSKTKGGQGTKMHNIIDFGLKPNYKAVKLGKEWHQKLLIILFPPVSSVGRKWKRLKENAWTAMHISVFPLLIQHLYLIGQYGVVTHTCTLYS